MLRRLGPTIFAMVLASSTSLAATTWHGVTLTLDETATSLNLYRLFAKDCKMDSGDVLAHSFVELFSTKASVSKEAIEVAVERNYRIQAGLHGERHPCEMDKVAFWLKSFQNETHWLFEALSDYLAHNGSDGTELPAD